LKHFVTHFFYDEGLLASRPTPKLEDHTLLAVHDYLFNIFAAVLHIWRPSPMVRWRAFVTTVMNLRVP